GSPQTSYIRVSPKSRRRNQHTLTRMLESRTPTRSPPSLRGETKRGITTSNEIEETPIRSPDIQDFVVEFARLLAAGGGFDILNHSFESLKNSWWLGIHAGASRHSMKRPDHLLAFLGKHEVDKDLGRIWVP